MRGLHVAYLHGFASSPSSRKGLLLREHLAADGVDVQLPDLRRPSFASLGHDAMLAAVDEMVAQADARAGGRATSWMLVGSSLGGHVAALWASLHPSHVAHLVLLCPAFDVPARWRKRLGDEGIARWRRDGAMPFPDDHGVMTPLHWGFYEEAQRHPVAPDVRVPTTILHGMRDDVVPLSSSEAYVAARPMTRRLVVVDDDHELLSSMDRIVDEVRSVLAHPGPTSA